MFLSEYLWDRPLTWKCDFFWEINAWKTSKCKWFHRVLLRVPGEGTRMSKFFRFFFFSSVLLLICVSSLRGHSVDNPECTCKHNAGDYDDEYEANPDCPVTGHSGWYVFFLKFFLLISVDLCTDFSRIQGLVCGVEPRWKANCQRQWRLHHQDLGLAIWRLPVDPEGALGG